MFLTNITVVLDTGGFFLDSTSNDIKEDIEDGINDLKEVNPMCVICSL